MLLIIFLLEKNSNKPKTTLYIFETYEIKEITSYWPEALKKECTSIESFKRKGNFKV